MSAFTDTWRVPWRVSSREMANLHISVQSSNSTNLSGAKKHMALTYLAPVVDDTRMIEEYEFLSLYHVFIYCHQL